MITLWNVRLGRWLWLKAIICKPWYGLHMILTISCFVCDHFSHSAAAEEQNVHADGDNATRAIVRIIPRGYFIEKCAWYHDVLLDKWIKHHHFLLPVCVNRLKLLRKTCLYRGWSNDVDNKHHVTYQRPTITQEKCISNMDRPLELSPLCCRAYLPC